MNCMFLRRGYGTSGDGVNYVEYIESDGDSYFDTGFKPNSNTRVVIEFEMPSVPDYNAWIFGARSESSARRFNAYVSSNGQLSISYDTTIQALGAVSANKRYTLDFNKNSYTLNGASGSLAASTFQTSDSMFLFSENRMGGLSQGLDVNVFAIT